MTSWVPEGEGAWRHAPEAPQGSAPVREADVGVARKEAEDEAGERPPETPGVAAFFDFDHTLLAGDAGLVFARSMAGWTMEQARDLPSPVSRAAFYARLTGIYAAMLGQAGALGALNKVRIVKRSKLLREAYKFFRGLPVDPIIDQMGAVFNDHIAARIFPEMRQLVHQHRDRGHRVVIVSTGPKLLLGHARGYLGEDVDVLGVELHHENGRFTGEITGPLYGADKADLLVAYAMEHHVDLTRSYAYSDHHSDLHFLEAVGHPVVVNPTARLRRTAHRRGWVVLEPEPPEPAWWQREYDREE